MSREPPPDPTAFVDPLQNYEPKTYDDPLELALADEPVTALQSTPFVSVPPDTPVHEAIRRLADLHVACLLVAEDKKLVGVFSHRDALNKVALEYEDVKDRPVREVMTTNPVHVYDTDSSAAVLTVMAISGYRHVPVLSVDGTIIGIASPQRVTGFLQQHLGDIST